MHHDDRDRFESPLDVLGQGNAPTRAFSAPVRAEVTLNGFEIGLEKEQALVDGHAERFAGIPEACPALFVKLPRNLGIGENGQSAYGNQCTEDEGEEHPPTEFAAEGCDAGKHVAIDA